MKKPIVIELTFVCIALLILFWGSWNVSGILILALITAVSSQLINYYYFRKQFQLAWYINRFLGVGIVVFVLPIIMAYILALYKL
jgi:hypothetical protein